jgi:hypothetical protein
VVRPTLHLQGKMTKPRFSEEKAERKAPGSADAPVFFMITSASGCCFFVPDRSVVGLRNPRGCRPVVLCLPKILRNGH